ncbi:outer membrane lipoprotein carrier protein LolA [Bacteroidales bacterium OttesenSCG-928-I21]|nr:outer membrane lipoprotein carrier protein LolA [Bacteroidales bacterium OttesenSCG-928-I21]
MRKLTYTLLITILYFTTNAQTSEYKPVSENRKKEIETELLKASKNLKDLECSFVQEKSSKLISETAKSEGILAYKAPSLLRWEYIKPIKFALILNENIYFKNENGVSENTNKLFKQMINLIVTTINGQNLIDSKNFKTDYFENTKHKETILVKLTPIAKRLKEMYTTIKIKINTSDFLASEIIMEEKTGDVMTITFVEKKINTNISEKSFVQIKN